MSKKSTVTSVPSIQVLLSMSDANLYDFIRRFLIKFSVPFDSDIPRNYIVTKASPELGPKPLICVHLDTVNRVSPPPTQAQIKTRNGIVSLIPSADPGLKCLGADDRAGVWIALSLIEYYYSTPTSYCPYYFGFFDLEECGGVGSESFASSHHYPEQPGTYQCFIGLDRGSRLGVQNIATYGYDNRDLLGHVQALLPEFDLQMGSFSDCSNLSGMTEDLDFVPCFNISVGYQHEHSLQETLSIAQMEHTLRALKTPGLIPAGELFPYPKPEPFRWVYPSLSTSYRHQSVYEIWDEFEEADPEGATPVVCDFCGKHLPLYEDEYDNLLCSDCLRFNKF